MKVAILAGGQGTRFFEESETRPKPMTEIGGRPILWHIMKHYKHCGFNDFLIALGYKGEVIRKYFDGPGGKGFKVELVDTGEQTETGGRIKRLAKNLKDGTFMLTWGDGVSDIDLKKLLEFHRSHGKLATLTVVKPKTCFGHVKLDGEKVAQFKEKAQISPEWINGAFFVLEPGIFDYISGDDTVWEKEPLEDLAKDGQLMAFKHTSFWQNMDTLHDRKVLEELWKSGRPPWKVWS